MCVKQVLQWVGIIPKPQKQPQQVQVPTAPPAQLQTRAAAALSETEKLQDEETTGKEKLKTKQKQKGFTDPRDALKSLGAQKYVAPTASLPTQPSGGITTPGGGG